VAAIISHAIDIELEERGRIGADVKGDLFTGRNAGAGAIAFYPRTTILGGGINPGLLEKPVTRAGFLVFFPNRIRSPGRSVVLLVLLWKGGAS